ncbi:MAG TPA: hypothetical protein VN327_05250 [Pseudonocardiaceae bacterium]|nr:hypothetical protein [Pseudonocardiaceae bacterium]
MAFRTARQQRLFGNRAPSLRVVLDEAVVQEQLHQRSGRLLRGGR